MPVMRNVRLIRVQSWTYLENILIWLVVFTDRLPFHVFSVNHYPLSVLYLPAHSVHPNVPLKKNARRTSVVRDLIVAGQHESRERRARHSRLACVAAGFNGVNARARKGQSCDNEQRRSSRLPRLHSLLPNRQLRRLLALCALPR